MTTRDEYEFKGEYSPTVFETLKMAYRSHAVLGMVFLSIGFFARGVLLFNANLLGFWVDSFCKEKATCKPVPSLFEGWQSADYLNSLLFLSLSGLLLTIIFRLGFSRLSVRAVSKIYDEVTFRTSRYPMEFFDQTPAGRVITRFSSDYGNIFRIFGGPFAEFITIIFDLIWMVLLTTFASPYYLPIVGMVGLIQYWVYRRDRESLRNRRRDLARSRSPSIAHFAETVQGAASIRAFLKQSSFKERFSKMNNFFLDQKFGTSRALLWFSYKMYIVTGLVLLLTATLGVFLVQNGHATVGSVGVAFTFITLSGSMLQMFFEWVIQFEEAMTGVERLDHYLRLPIEPESILPAEAEFQTGHPIENGKMNPFPTPPTRSEDGPYSAEIEFKNVSFRYSQDLPFVLKNLDLKVHAGEHLGIIGRTGSGKSTLIQALFGLYPLTEGEILLNGMSPFGSKTIGLDAYRRNTRTHSLSRYSPRQPSIGPSKV
jgi:ABC-type multidrug transport system fused ATPase/permease subunit